MKKYFLDTNTLILWLVGSTHPEWLGKRKPVSDLDEEDYTNLNEILSDAKAFVTLPYVLAETSNLIGFGKRNTATPALFLQFRRYVENCQELKAVSQELVARDAMSSHGLTDYAIITLVRNGVVTVTQDFKLFGVLQELGLPVENLRHRRKL
ncbi:hypothetical protein [Shimia biformata]|uniref:hypothetical protein n=1 Tax=Shimia biformata TaxID=1294299 RepID=UPI0019524C17|nr:hypothetical protein [Shimia biformata]